VNRRDFILSSIALAAGCPLPAWAQPTAPPVIGFLRSADLPNLLDAFRRGLGEAGLIDGQSYTIAYRSAENRRDRLPALARELVENGSAVIVANSVAALAAKHATAGVPIVFVTGSDPVRDGLVSSLNRPGGNVTGVSFLAGTLGAKRLELLRQLAPAATTIGALIDPGITEGIAERADLRVAAQAIGQAILVAEAGVAPQLEPAVKALAEGGAGAVVVGAGPFLTTNRRQVIALLQRHRLAGIFSIREAAVEGGLISYGTSQTDAYRQAGLYVARILAGDRPGDLPVMLGSKFELVLNLRTARALGLAMPDRLLALADEVIE
jgi:putative ABC transport system substrate-binding protein